MCYSVLVKQDLKLLESRFGAVPVRQDFADFEKLVEVDPKKYKPMAAHARIYPNYFAPVITGATKGREIFPMRYRIRPAGSTEEVPAKYNMFNARLDALDSRRTWKGLFGKQHGILVFERFFEWVADAESGKKKVISFHPRDRDLMWSPVLWDEWRAPTGELTIRSFAIITTDPPPEVSAMGHDRCPIFLAEAGIDAWLHPEKHSVKELKEILASTEQTYFDWDKVA